jgi:hypothetical protein
MSRTLPGTVRWIGQMSPEQDLALRLFDTSAVGEHESRARALLMRGDVRYIGQTARGGGLM